MPPLSILPHLKQLVNPVGQKTATFLFLHFGRCTTALQLHSPKEKYVRQNVPSRAFHVTNELESSFYQFLSLLDCCGGFACVLAFVLEDSLVELNEDERSSDVR